MRFKYIFVLLFLSFAASQNCNDEWSDLETGELFDIKQCNETKPCIVKCCKKDEIFNKNGKVLFCNKNEEGLEHMPLKFNKNEYLTNITESNKTLEDFRLVHNNIFMNTSCRAILPISTVNHPHILENGKFVEERIEIIVGKWQEHKMLTFCYDTVHYKLGETPVTKTIYYSFNPKPIGQPSKLKTGLHTAASVVECFFFILSFVINIIIGKHKILKDKLFLAQIVTLFTLSLTKLIFLTTLICGWFGTVEYYAILSSMLWLNVGSFEIWRNFRSFKNMTKSFGRDKLQKRNRKLFFYYCLYAMGPPAIMTVIAKCIDEFHLNVKYNFEGPALHLCFSSQTKLDLYVNYPMAAILLVNLIFFIRTLQNIINNTKNDKKSFKEFVTKQDKKSKFLFFKLSALMGLNWLLLIVQIHHRFPEWFVEVLDAYNRLNGVLIFFLFVASKDTFNRLKSRLQKCSKGHDDFGTSRTEKYNSSRMSSQI